MPFPEGIETVTLTGHQTRADGDGSPLPLRVRPVPRRVVSAVHGVIVDDEWVTITPGDDGQWSVELLAVDAAGASAYAVAVAGGFEGTEAEWLASLEGEPGSTGAAGASAYQVAVSGGFVGTQAQWLASLKGAKGDPGVPPTGDTVGVIRTVDKPTDEPLTTSTTLQDDDHLTLSVTAGGRYAIAAMLAVSGDPAADLTLTLAAPPGSTGHWTPGAITLGVSDGTGSLRLTRYDLGTPIGVGIIAGGLVVAPLGTLTAGANGVLTVQWAQNVASATPTIVRTGSWLQVTRTA